MRVSSIIWADLEGLLTPQQREHLRLKSIPLMTRLGLRVTPCSDCWTRTTDTLDFVLQNISVPNMGLWSRLFRKHIKVCMPITISEKERGSGVQLSLPF